MTQLKTVIWPGAPPAKPESAEPTFAAKRRAAEIIAGLEREGVAATLKDDRLRVTAKGVHAALRWLRSSAAPISSKPTCSPKPSNRDCPPYFREQHALNAPQHIARGGRRDRG